MNSLEREQLSHCYCCFCSVQVNDLTMCCMFHHFNSVFFTKVIYSICSLPIYAVIILVCELLLIKTHISEIEYLPLILKSCVKACRGYVSK